MTHKDGLVVPKNTYKSDNVGKRPSTQSATGSRRTRSTDEHHPGGGASKACNYLPKGPGHPKAKHNTCGPSSAKGKY
ncbi:MAG: hypothetical protein V3W06_09120 [Acidimicrobiia bacterium]